MPYERIPLPLLDGFARRSSIRRVLLVILAVSLLPLVFLASWNGVARIRLDAQEQQQKLAEAAALTASSELNVIHAAEGVLTLLAANADVRSGDPERCSKPLATIAGAFPAYSYLAFTDAEGRVRCASQAGAVGRDVGQSPYWLQVPRDGFSVSKPLRGEFSRRDVLWATWPIHARDGRLEGVLSASIDLNWLKRLIAARPARDDTIVLLVDGGGQVIASSRPVNWSRIPLPADNARINSVRDSQGQIWDYAVAPLHAGGGKAQAGASYHILYAAPQPGMFGPRWWIAASTFALPVLALFLSSLAIWFGANRAILRWIGHLGRLAQDIGEGKYRSRDDSFADAPTEIRGLAADLHRMARTIAERDRSLTETLAQQRALTFELHHRVRNNLQIIASYLRLQIDALPRGDRSPGLEALRLRVGALALVHRLLFDSAETAALSTSDLVEPLCRLLSQDDGVFEGFHILCEIEAHPVGIDTAIPLTLWIVEAADRLALRGSPAGNAEIVISLTAPSETGGGLVLSVEASGLGPAVQPQRAAGRLLDNISRQLDGRLEQVELSDNAAAITLHLGQRPITGNRVGITPGISAGNNPQDPALERHGAG